MAVLHLTVKKPLCYRHPVLEMVQVFTYLILSLLETLVFITKNFS